MEALVWYCMDKNLQNNIHTYFIRYKFKKYVLERIWR